MLPGMRVRTLFSGTGRTVDTESLNLTYYKY